MAPRNVPVPMSMQRAPASDKISVAMPQAAPVLPLADRADRGHDSKPPPRSLEYLIGMFGRLEWETEIEGEGPYLKAAARTPVGDAVGGKRASRPLGPVLETVVDRTTWRVTRDGPENRTCARRGSGRG
jgi:hypothetical protein